MEFLDLGQVRLAPSAFSRAVETDLAYALALDPDRLLAPFGREANLPAKAPGYGNWEDSGLDGHTAGHYLSALAFLWQATGRVEARRRIETMLDGLDACQQAGGDGYIGGIPGGRGLFESLAVDGLDAVAALSGSTYWVPWYNLHKTFQGLIDVHVVLGDQRALRIVLRLADWWLDIAGRIDDEVFEAMLGIEFGGMNDAFAQLSQLTGRADHAEAARRFSHRVILDPLLRGEDALTGLHANTQIPKAVGYATTAAATGDEELMEAADYFWRTVVDRRTVAIGGNSVREHFHDADDFSTMIDDREGPEFCNTYNMLKLTRALAEHRLRPEYLDFAERALFNHVLASQHPDGGFVYFTPMRPRHYRVYSQPELCFWCCVGTGLEAQARHGEWVFGIEDGALAVNLFIPAEADIAAFGARVRVDADLPHSGKVAVTMALEEPRDLVLRIRVPGWAGELKDLRVDGIPVQGETVPGAVLLARTWEPGQRVTFNLPLHLRSERLPDGSPWQAYLLGPSVLAARDAEQHLRGFYADDSRMGHVAAGPLLPLGDLPIVRAGPPVAGQPDPFTVASLDREHLLRLEPFAGIHDARYTVYWPVADDGDVAQRRIALEQADCGLLLDEVTVDSVALGEQQPESDHQFRAEGARVVTARHGRWRVTDSQLSVRMQATGARVLRVRYLTSDVPTAVIVTVAGSVVGSENFPGGSEVLDVEYSVWHVLSQLGEPGPVAITLSAGRGRATPAIGELRLLR